MILEPCDARGAQPSGPGYFEITAAPGSTTQLYVLLGNTEVHRTGINLVPVDATSGVYGGISYALPQQKSRKVGTWLGPATHDVTLGTNQSRVIPITLRVPRGAAPGQYVGGLTAFGPETRQPAAAPHRGGGAIALQLRRVVAVVVTVPGPTFARSTIGSVVPKRRPDGVYLVAHVHNSGGRLLQGQGHLWVWSRTAKKTIVSAQLRLDTTVPHSTVRYPILWSKRPAPGIYAYALTVRRRSGAVTKHGRFWVR